MSAPTKTPAKSSSSSSSLTPSKSLSAQLSNLSISTVQGSGQRRLSTSNSVNAPHSPSTPSPKSPFTKDVKPDTAKLTQTRRRLSIMGGSDAKLATRLDGVTTDEVKDKSVNKYNKAEDAPISPHRKKRIFSAYASLSKVGYVPFNPNKVNQDRSCEILRFNGNEDRAFFGVFDGHGSLGHEVSQFCATELPKSVIAQKNLDTDPHDAIMKAFVDCNFRLSKTTIDCAFSGTTAITVYIDGDKIYGCNAGDSRAILGRLGEDGKITAVPLSQDHKPDRPDEKKRILDNRGRVEACKGPRGEDIGPPRVWLQTQDVPGLAMTRSMGDFIAASVGVTCKPEIIERVATDDDRFMILASDGVWEFISNQEACDIVFKAKNPEEACRALVEESTKRWHAEEEVVDDITCIVAFF